MKLLTLSAAIFFCCTLARAQKIKETDVPKNVRNAFANAYPYEKNVVWGKEKGLYAATFAKNNQGQSVLLNMDGSIREVDTRLNQYDLPKNVRDILSKGYNGYIVVKANEIQSNGITTYKADVSKGLSMYELTFDANGKLLRKLDKRARLDDEMP
jgi:Putative beta-lactamase-inhibitor-like, PepSY-like